jgi:hypothetical protein
MRCSIFLNERISSKIYSTNISNYIESYSTDLPIARHSNVLNGTAVFFTHFFLQSSIVKVIAM